MYQSTHTGAQVDEAVDKVLASPISMMSNRNLLDNWYFVGGGSQQGGGQFPINQRGQTTYSNSGYGIDRWIVSGYGSLALNTGYISFETRTMYGGFTQRFEEGAIKDGSKLTLSVLTDTGLYSVTFTASKTTPYASDTTWLGVSGLYAYFGWYSSGGAQYWQIYIVDNADGQSHTVNLIAAKLEMGADQTLAHQESGVWVLNDIPNFAEELAKCQRYFYNTGATSSAAIAVNGLRGDAAAGKNMGAQVITPVVMRTTPTVDATMSSIRGNGSIWISSLSVSNTPLAVFGNLVILDVQCSTASFPAYTNGYAVIFSKLQLSADL